MVMMENNDSVDLGEIRWKGVDKVHLAQNRDSCEHDNEPSDSTKGGEFLD
jgi:hypothetical protein